PLFNILSPSNPTGISRSDMTMIWKAIAEILFDPHIQKIGQNFKFDESLLETCVNRTANFGMKVYGFYFDTMLAFKTLYPELPARLEFISSVLTEEPYYKDEGKEFNPKKDKLDRLLLYNAKDAAVTYEVYEREMEELNDSNNINSSFDRITPLHTFYSRIQHRGIRQNQEVKKNLDKKYRQ